MNEWLGNAVLLHCWIMQRWWASFNSPVKAAMKADTYGVRFNVGHCELRLTASPSADVDTDASGGSSHGDVIWASNPAASDFSSKLVASDSWHSTWKMTFNPPHCNIKKKKKSNGLKSSVVQSTNQRRLTISNWWMMSAEEQRAARARRRSQRSGRRWAQWKASTSVVSAGRAASAPSDVNELVASLAADRHLPFFNASVSVWFDL